MRDFISGMVVQTMLKAASRTILSVGSPRWTDRLPAAGAM
jgi:hypothetical protein